jgi:hypothetical protein
MLVPSIREAQHLFFNLPKTGVTDISYKNYSMQKLSEVRKI